LLQVALADARASDPDNMKPGTGLPRFRWQPLSEARGRNLKPFVVVAH